MTYVRRKAAGALGLLMAAAFFVCGASVSAQTKPAVTTGVSETSASLGLGSQTRFASGYTPIKIERTTIVPGMPFKVKATMDNFISTSKETFGGILNRYDTSQFGRFFSLGKSTTGASASPMRTLPSSANGTGIASQTDSKRMYPPRLAIDFADYPATDSAAPEFKQSIDKAVRRILRRRPLDEKTEQLTLVFQGERIVLRGKVNSPRTVETLRYTLGMEPGVTEVVSELEVAQPDQPASTDPLGWEKAE